MLSINMSDVYSVLELCAPYIAVIGAALLLAVAVSVIARKWDRIKRKFVRSQTWIVWGLVVVVMANLMITGPLSSMVSLVFAQSGTISEESTESATALAEQIAEEGIVLLKNEEDVLPLSGTKNLNVFGWASTNPVYGGTGSGSLSANYPTVSLLEGLENAGFSVNEELTEFYEDYRADRPEVGMFDQDWTLPEPPADTYSDELISNAKEYSDTAVIVISRVGGEGADLPVDVSAVTYTDNSDQYKDFEDGEHYLQLSRSEKDMVELVTENFDRVIVVYNGANAMELGWVNEYDSIKSVLWCPGTGQSGFNSLGRILNGEVNPSGKTSDTFVSDLTQTPTWNNFGHFAYDNMDEFGSESNSGKAVPTFVNYVEGIYVGYRYYETAAAEGQIDYDDAVVYPFGYGLSYTDFEQVLNSVEEENGVITVSVTVTNTGDTAGKDVVEVYYNPPYINGGIEKASANLIEYAKTDALEPGESQTVELTFDVEDMASYSSAANDGNGAYVLDEGDYIISINSDSHTIIDSETYTIDSTIVYDEENKRSSDETAATNQFADSEGDVVYLSRADHFANYEEATAAPTDFTYDDKDTYVNNSNYNEEDYNDDSDEIQ